MISVKVATLEAIPSTAKHSADGVCAALDQVRHVVGLILNSLVVAGPTWGEKLIAYTLPVQVQLVKTVASDIRARLLDNPRYLEFAAQHGRRAAGYVIRSRLDPICAPVRGLKQSHLPMSRRTPIGNGAFAIPKPDMPPISVSRLQRRPVI